MCYNDRFGIYNLKNLNVLLEEGEKYMGQWGVGVRHVIKMIILLYVL